MNEGSFIDPKSMHEVCLEVNVNSRSSRLPMIVIQTPAEVEAGLPSYCSIDEAIKSQEKNVDVLCEFNSVNWRQRLDSWNSREIAEGRSTFGSTMLDPAKDIRPFWLSRSDSRSIDFRNDWRPRMAGRKGRSRRYRTKKSIANEQKHVVEDALCAFKKMKLNYEEVDDHLME